MTLKWRLDSCSTSMGLEEARAFISIMPLAFQYQSCGSFPGYETNNQVDHLEGSTEKNANQGLQLEPCAQSDGLHNYPLMRLFKCLLCDYYFLDAGAMKKEAVCF